MCGHTLQFGPTERFHRPSGQSDDRIRRTVTRRKSVDSRFWQLIDHGHRRTGGDRHLLDDVQRPALQAILSIR